MKRVNTLLSVTLILLMFLSCNNKKEKEQVKMEKEQVKKDKYAGVINPSLYRDLANNEKARTRLWKAAIDSGDCNAYGKIATAYIMTHREVDTYYYSLIMANKYHCPEAYLTMYTILINEASTGDMVILSKDKDTKNLALYYLFRARELGSTQAQFSIESLGKKESLKNASFFLMQLMKP